MKTKTMKVIPRKTGMLMRIRRMMKVVIVVVRLPGKKKGGARERRPSASFRFGRDYPTFSHFSTAS